MLKCISYPTCNKSFIEFCTSDKIIFNESLTKILRVIPFDVTLRDGLQALSSSEQEIYTIDIKKKIYNHLLNKYSPNNLEIGSVVSFKILPIFKNTQELLMYAENINKYHNTSLNHYILVPNKEKLLDCLKFGVKNFSFITSVSNSFQLKNTKMSLDENYNNLNNMLNVLDNYFNIDNQNKDIYNVKLYVSCINECPIEGYIETNTIVKTLVKLNYLKINKICLSDTCGSLTMNDFSNILDGLKKNGIDSSKLSLHLHVNPERIEEVERIVHLALDNNIIEFDVSELTTGGCSITMNKNTIIPNMNYEQYYRFLTNYLIKNTHKF